MPHTVTVMRARHAGREKALKPDHASTALGLCPAPTAQALLLHTDVYTVTGLCHRGAARGSWEYVM